jgi:hypothetical protein
MSVLRLNEVLIAPLPRVHNLAWLCGVCSSQLDRDLPLILSQDANSFMHKSRYMSRAVLNFCTKTCDPQPSENGKGTAVERANRGEKLRDFGHEQAGIAVQATAQCDNTLDWTQYCM